jgi:hypothetical protein
LSLFGICARALTVREFIADLNTGLSLGHRKVLKVGVYRDKLRALNSSVYHSIYGVISCATDTNNLDNGG